MAIREAEKWLDARYACFCTFFVPISFFLQAIDRKASICFPVAFALYAIFYWAWYKMADLSDAEHFLPLS